MNHDKARQKQTDKLWHYTSANDGHVWPIGHCADGCPGHATEAEACEHQRQYLLDNLKFYPDSADPSTLHRCEAAGCKNMTDGSARVIGGWNSHFLCNEHRNRETMDKIIREVGESWHS